MYELIVDNEWVYEGKYEAVEKMAETYWADEEEIHDVKIMTEEEFYYGK